MRLIDSDEAKKQVRQMQVLTQSEKNLLTLALDRTPTYEQPNAPLTLEQLWEMDGEPVWVERHSNFDCIPHWALVHVHRKGNVYLTERNCGQILFRIGDKVYRCKPEDRTK